MPTTDNSDRTHPATPRRRAEAREQGHVPQSGDLSSALMLGGGALLLSWQGPGLVMACGDWLSQSFSSGVRLRGGQLGSLPIGQPLMVLLTSAIGFLASLWLVSVIVRLMQVGPLLTPGAVQPRGERISPAAGLRRMFGTASGLRGCFWLLKLTAIASLIWWTLSHEAGLLADMMSGSPGQLAVALGTVTTSFALRLCGVLLTLAVADYGCQRWLHERSLRMTSEEIRAERRDMRNQRRSVRSGRAVESLSKPLAD